MATTDSPLTSGTVLASMVTIPDRGTIMAAARAQRFDYDVVDAAARHLLSGEVASGVLSGKMASGKDTVAEHLAEYAHRPGQPTAQVHRTSDPIRSELDQAIDLIVDSPSRDAAVRALTSVMELPYAAAAHIVSVLFDATRHAHPRAGDRNNTNRALLQFLADEGRRSVDPDYWVRRCLGRMLPVLASGASVFLSGGRYPNEVQPAQVLGLTVIRLEVALETQIERVRARDGHEPDPALFLDPNECALDGYSGFNIQVTNDRDLGPTMAVLKDHVDQHRAYLAR